MRLTLLLSVVWLFCLWPTAAQEDNDMERLTDYSYRDIENIMSNSTRLIKLIDCIVEVEDCSQDPLGVPLHSKSYLVAFRSA